MIFFGLIFAFFFLSNPFYYPTTTSTSSSSKTSSTTATPTSTPEPMSATLAQFQDSNAPTVTDTITRQAALVTPQTVTIALATTTVYQRDNAGVALRPIQTVTV